MAETLGARLAGWSALADEGTFEQALAALDEVVALLEGGGHGLDDTIAAYEVGTRIARRCDDLLAAAELRVSQISVGEDEDRGGTAEPAPTRISRWRTSGSDGEGTGATTPSSDEPPF